MLVQMDDTPIQTLEDIRQFLAGTTETPLKLEGGKDDIYRWIEHTLVRFHYMWLGKKGRGLVLRYIERLSGYSRQQITRLARQYRQTGRLRRRQRTTAGFATRYTRDDIALLAAVDRLLGDASGTIVKAFCRRMLEVYGDQRFGRLAGISVSHLYNLRHGRVYRGCRRTFSKTQAAKVQIAERTKPQPQGQPGYLRIDSVHQGDMDGKKGLYHINAVDEVTQWEIIVSLARIRESFVLPALPVLLEQFPFRIQGFHSDNGSEYINHKVAELLQDRLIRQTKSRPRHCNDNALAECKNGAVVRRAFGYDHVAQRHAELVNAFNVEFLNPCLNFHRPCHFPTIETDARGKQRRRYRQQDVMTPYEKLASLPDAASYLREDVSLEQLEAIARRHSDIEAWERMRQARGRLFDTILQAAPRSP